MEFYPVNIHGIGRNMDFGGMESGAGYLGRG